MDLLNYDLLDLIYEHGVDVDTILLNDAKSRMRVVVYYILDTHEYVVHKDGKLIISVKASDTGWAVQRYNFDAHRVPHVPPAMNLPCATLMTAKTITITELVRIRLHAHMDAIVLISMNMMPRHKEQVLKTYGLFGALQMKE